MRRYSSVWRLVEKGAVLRGPGRKVLGAGEQHPIISRALKFLSFDFMMRWKT